MESSKSKVYTSRVDSLQESLGKLWEYKALIWVFAKRDIQVKYSQTYFGFGWSIFKPVLGFSIYVLFFGVLLKWTTNDIPFPIYVLTGLIGWNLFAYIVSNGISSIQESNDIIRKIYFPKSVLPLSKSLVGIIEAFISIGLTLPLLFYYQIDISWHLIFFPFVLLFNVICGLAFTFLISSLAIVKRDLLQVIPFLLNMAIWFTPVFFSIDILPKQFQFLMLYNPISNMIELWRWLFFNSIDFQPVWLINLFVICFLFVITFYIYTSKESKITDHL